MNTSWDRILAEVGPRQDNLGVAAALRLVRSPLALRTLHWVAPYNPRMAKNQRAATAFLLDLVRRLFAEHPERVVWASILTPAELIWGLGLTPFLPEVGTGAARSLGLTPRGVKKAAEAGCPTDICTIHRAALGLARDGLFPPPAAVVSSSQLCTIAGMLLAAEAQRYGKPFTLIDLPPTADSEALDYVEGQLEALAGQLAEATGRHYDPERLRHAVQLSNRARERALEFHRLRESRPAPIRGSQMLDSIALVSWMLGHPDGVAYFKAWRDYTAERIRRSDPEQPNQKLRLYWMHIGPADKSIVQHLEEDLNAAIAFEEHSTIWWDELDEDRPFRALAARLLTQPGQGAIERRIELVLNSVERYHCDGVVHFSHWGCRQTSGAVRVVRDRLRREGVPFLDLDGDSLDETNMQLGPLRTRIDAFVETLS